MYRLDYLTAREPFLEEIKILIDKGIRHEIDLFTSSLIIADVHYFIQKTGNANMARSKIDQLASSIRILNVGEDEILSALNSKFKDFEDSIQNSCAINSHMDIIVTRNIKGLRASKLSILTPREVVTKLEQK